MTKKKQTFINNLIASLVPVALMLLASLRFGFNFDLNDDVTIRNILSGAYTGEPSAFAIYIQYPLAFILSGLYSLFGTGIKWFSLFILGCQSLAVYAVNITILSNIENHLFRILAFISSQLFLVGILTKNFCYSQYTVTSGILSAAAIFIFMINEKNAGKSVALLFLAFMLRTKSMLLVLPIAAMGAVFKYFRGGERTWKRGRKFVIYALILLALMAISTGIHRFMYRGGEWKAYETFNEARTGLYDYGFLPSYEENQDFYTSINISYDQYSILMTYNLDLDGSITADQIETINERAKEIKYADMSYGEILIKTVKEYVKKLISVDDLPLNLLTIFLYLTCLIICIHHRDLLSLVWIVALGFGRSMIWMFLIYMNRCPNRILEPLYFVELAVLLGVIYIDLQGKTVEKSVLVTLLVAMLISLPIGWGRLVNYETTYSGLEDKFINLRTYVAEHPNNIYLWDTFSGCTYAEKMFGDEEPNNIVLLGGWLSRSPLLKARIENLYDVVDLRDASLKDDVYYIVTGERGAQDYANWHNNTALKEEYIYSVSSWPIDLIEEENEDLTKHVIFQYILKY